MKLFLLFLLTLTLCSVVVQASGRRRRDRRCIKKVQKCCWHLERCGSVKRKVKRSKNCDFKICKPDCHKKCYRKSYRKCDRHGRNCYDKGGRRYCKDVCKDVCHVIHKTCIYYDVFRYHRFCPVLKCNKIRIRGRAVKPDGYVSKDGKLVRSYRKGRKRRNRH